MVQQAEHLSVVADLIQEGAGGGIGVGKKSPEKKKKKKKTFLSLLLFFLFSCILSGFLFPFRFCLFLAFLPDGKVAIAEAFGVGIRK